MTAPRRDGRSMLERARELAKLSPYQIHERPSEALDAIRMLLDVAEAARKMRAVAGDMDERAYHEEKDKLDAALAALAAPVPRALPLSGSRDRR